MNVKHLTSFHIHILILPGDMKPFHSGDFFVINILIHCEKSRCCLYYLFIYFQKFSQEESKHVLNMMLY